MAMSREAYAALVDRLEQDAVAHPVWYAIRVIFLIALGFLYIPVMIVVNLLLVLLLIGVGLVIRIIFTGAIGALLKASFRQIGAVCTALRFHFDPPPGLTLERAQAPALFEMVDEITTQLRAPRCHVIRLDNHFNASMAQVPRLGLLGFQRNYLTLGLPLMHALSREAFRTVLIHELTHLSGNHGRFSGWTYRVGAMWERFMEQITQHEGESLGMAGFYQWYEPRIRAYAFALSRAHEMQADRRAAEMLGMHVAAEAEVASNVLGHYLLEVYGPALLARADTESLPPPDAMRTMLTVLRRGVPAEELQASLEQALLLESNLHDPHPCFKARLAAYGYPVTREEGRARLHPDLHLPTPPAMSAAEALLGLELEPLIARFETIWRAKMLTLWKHRFHEVRTGQAQLAKLDATAEGPLTEEQQLERANILLKLNRESEALPLLQGLLADNPRHATANYLVGRILIDRKDFQGIAHLNTVMEEDPESTPEVIGHIYGFLLQQGKMKEAQDYLTWADAKVEWLQRAYQRLQEVTPHDTFSPPEWTEEQLATVRGELATVANLDVVFLAKKTIPELPKQSIHVLCAVSHYGMLHLRSEGSDNAILERLLKVVTCPSQTIFCIIARRNEPLPLALAALPDTCVYDRKEKVHA